MGMKTVRHPPYSPDLAPCDFWLFPKLRGCRFKTIEEMKAAVTKVIDTLTQDDFHGAFQKLLERYNKCIATGGDYFEVDKSFMCVLSIKVPVRKKVWKLIVCTSYIYSDWDIYLRFAEIDRYIHSFLFNHFHFFFLYSTLKNWTTDGLHLRYYVHFWTNSQRKGIYTLLPTQLLVKQYHYYSSRRIALALNNRRMLICH